MSPWHELSVWRQWVAEGRNHTENPAQMPKEARRQGGRQSGQVWHCTHGGPDRWNLWEGWPSLMNTDVCRSVLSCCLFCCTLYAHHNPFITLPSCAPPFIFLRFTASLCSYLIFFRLFFFLIFFRPSIVLMSPRLSEYEHRTSHNRYANKQIFWLDGYKCLQECPPVTGALHMKQWILAKMCTNYRTTANREWMYSCESIKSQMLQMHLHANSIEFPLRFLSVRWTAWFTADPQSLTCLVHQHVWSTGQREVRRRLASQTAHFRR